MLSAHVAFALRVPVLLAHAEITQKTQYFSMGPKLRYPAVQQSVRAGTVFPVANISSFIASFVTYALLSAANVDSFEESHSRHRAAVGC